MSRAPGAARFRLHLASSTVDAISTPLLASVRLMSPRHTQILAVASIAAGMLLAGCGGALYATHASSAESKLEQAKHLGAETLAPYEYYFAREHLEKAKSEAAEGDYSDAMSLAELAEEHADKAIKLSREAHRGAGR